MSEEQTPDYLATINANTGIGSWARHERLEEAVASVARIFYQDYNGILNLEGEDVPVTVYDVRGHDRLAISPMGARPADGGDYLPIYHQTTVTMPKAKAKAKRRKTT